ncbi:hypothetical protein CRG98_018189 [Punica granatum]|uniref:Uncharacterized protein n=1 Tax=Punica granatum TaxID=22663 RepID=A0A2I0JYN1_PUNGR|nr:hypothetical protein CRG98_018189 [Punica granatum]
MIAINTYKHNINGIDKTAPTHGTELGRARAGPLLNASCAGGLVRAAARLGRKLGCWGARLFNPEKRKSTRLERKTETEEKGRGPGGCAVALDPGRSRSATGGSEGRLERESAELWECRRSRERQRCELWVQGERGELREFGDGRAVCELWVELRESSPQEKETELWFSFFRGESAS